MHRGIPFLMLLLLTSSCVPEPQPANPNEPLPVSYISSDNSIKTIGINKDGNPEESVIGHLKNESNPPRHDTWLETLESFPEITAYQTIEPTNPASIYAIGNEEYYFLKEQNITLVRHILLNAIIGVYENTSPEALIPILTAKNYTKQSPDTPKDKVYLYETFDAETYKQMKTNGILVYIQLYDDSKGISDSTKKYLSGFFAEVKNNTVAGFIVPFSRAAELGFPGEKLTSNTSLIIEGDKVLAKYIGIYTSDDLMHEFIRILYRYVVSPEK
jgi:hypothetical protein